jgi:biotin-dependent carboxylase-like uncharacterized protein
MVTAIEVAEAGLAVTVQDRGRFGLRRLGVPVSGALDPLTLAAANLLLGNAPDAAGLEIVITGPTLAATDQPVGVVLAGELRGEIAGVGAVPPWRAVALAPGQSLAISAPRRGIGYVALSGGVLSEPILGSRSTYRRAGLGRPLQQGDRLPCAPAAVLRASLPWRDAEGPIRLLAGPQDDHFPESSLEALTAAPYRVAADSDRMGLRLIGARLPHNDKGADIVTDGVLPGAIQVPAGGQPILLMADAQTSGGYAKIAVVITADMARLGHCRSGDEIAFRWVDRQEARTALAAQNAAFAAWRDSIGRIPGMIDEAALYRQNLISGASAGEEDEEPI